ncbi:Sec7-domain-containing protein [Wallemia mellicola]|nr:Sec7-domain-containing protein [Wallemia mellicola]TIC72677.1 Sec7-domain-containing protein [Wallemia mellicola]
MKSNSIWFNHTTKRSNLDNLASDVGLQRFKKSDSQLDLFSSLSYLSSKLPSLKQLDTIVIFSPFLDIVSSANTSGPITLASLDSIDKFLSSHLLTTSSINALATINKITDAITHCTFDPSDNQTDDAILSRILDIINFVLTSDLVTLCSDSTVCALIQTNLSMASQIRLSPALRNSAERTMQSVVRSLVLSYKSRYQFSQPSDSPIDTPQTSQDISTPFSHPTMSELISVLVKLLDPHDPKHTDTIRLASLRILDVALTTGGKTLSNVQSIRSTLSDQGCKYLFQLARLEASPLLIMTMRVITLLFDTFKPYLKLQQELFMSFLVERLSPSNSNSSDLNSPDYQPPFDPYYTWEASVMPQEAHNVDNENDKMLNTSGSATPSLAPAKSAKPAFGTTRQLLLETLVYFIHRPGFLSELWLNYDSDIDCDDIFERTLSFIVQGIFPQENSSLDSQILCLDATSSFLSQMNETIVKTDDEANLQYPTNIALKKSRKKVILNGARKFNIKPTTGLDYLARHGIIDINFDEDNKWTKETSESVAKFLKQCARLDKRLLGDYLSRPDNIEVLKSFFSLFNFENLSVADSMRQALETFRLPGEAQQIARITEVYAESYFSSSPKGINSQDAVYVLAYSVILLNTDLHNPQNRARRMSIDDYKRNLRGVNDGKDFSPELLEDVYHSIRKREIVMPEEHHDQLGFDYAWKEMLFRSKTAGTVTDATSPNLVKPIFESSYRKLLVGLSYAFASFNDSFAISKVIEAYRHLMMLSSRLKIAHIPDLAFISLRRATGMFVSRFSEDEFTQATVRLSENAEPINLSVTSFTVQFGEDVRAQLAAWTCFTVILKGHLDSARQSWDDIFEIFLSLFHNDLLPESIQSMEDFLGGSTPIPAQGHSSTEKNEIGASNNSNSTSLLSTLSSYLLSPYSNESHMAPQATEGDIEATLKSIDCVNVCNLDILYKDLLKLSSETFAFALSSLRGLVEKRTTEKLVGLEKYNKKGTPPITIPYDRQTVFLLEVMISMSVRNNDLVEVSWPIVFPVLEKILSFSNVFSTLLTERAAVGLSKLTLAISKKESLHEDLFISIDLLRSLPHQQLLASISDHLLTLVEGILASPEILHNATEWRLTMSLLQSSSGDGERSLAILSRIIENQLTSDSINGVLSILLSLSYMENTRALEMLLSLRDASISNSASEWDAKLEPLGLTLTELCLHPSRQIRGKAIEGLSLILLEHPEKGLSVFPDVLFPLLEKLLRPDVFKRDPSPGGMLSTRAGATNLVCKMWLLVDLKTPDGEVEKNWLDLLDFLDRFVSSITNVNQNSVQESILENLKNLLLVMSTNGIISTNEEKQEAYQLYNKTVERVDLFLQGFVNDVLCDSNQQA